MVTQTDAPLSILHIVAPGEVGGLESVVQALATGHSGRGHAISVAAVFEPRSGGHPFVAALQSAGVRTMSFCLPARAYLKERRLIRVLLEAAKPDVVHTHGYRPDVLHGAGRTRRGWRTVTTLHGSSRVGGSSTIHEILQLMVLRRFDAVVAVSRLLAERLRGVWVRGDHLHVIPNAWSGRAHIAGRAEARRDLGLSGDAFVIGWVGRLIRVKGADVFLRAVACLSDVPVTASIIGDGSERLKLQAWVREHGLAPRVRFHGTVSDAGRYMAAFDVFVLSSRSEGTPMTLLEAMAARVPLVVTSVGGVADVVGSAEAVLIRPERPADLAAAIRDVMLDPVTAAKRAEAAYARLRSAFGLDRWLAAYEDLYREVIARGR